VVPPDKKIDYTKYFIIYFCRNNLSFVVPLQRTGSVLVYIYIYIYIYIYTTYKGTNLFWYNKSQPYNRVNQTVYVATMLSSTQHKTV
jgi:hypothetical protein